MQALLSCFSKNYHLKNLPPSSAAPPPPPPRVTAQVLAGQDAETSAAIIAFFSEDERFAVLGRWETDLIIARDQEDADKLLKGIQLSVSKGVIPHLETPPTYKMIDVIGKTPDDVCSVVLSDVGRAANKGCVIVLCGLSGTGKGTTVAKLQDSLPNCVCWSNGNVFRALTLLAVTWCKLFNFPNFNKVAALTPANLAAFVSMLSFGQHKGVWDIRITGLGLDVLVSEIKNTTLKAPEVAKNIPTVAEMTQGEVIRFAADATRQMCEHGVNVLLEGREATVNYVETPYRYTLTMNDTQVIGKRRAAQRIGAEALRKIQEAGEEEGNSSTTTTGETITAPSVEDVEKKVVEALGAMVEEMKGDEKAASYLAELDKPAAADANVSGEGAGEEDEDADL